MGGERQREWLTGLLESLPSIVFLAFWRSGAEPALAGWIGTGLAALLLLGFRCARLPHNPILLGINLHLLVITPLIVGAFRLGAGDLGRALLAASESGVLVSVFLVGCGLTAFSARGFVGAEGLAAPIRRAYSLLLLAVCAVFIPWSFATLGQTLLSIALPLAVLFGLRRLLIARAQNRQDRMGAAGALAVAGGPD